VQPADTTAFRRDDALRPLLRLYACPAPRRPLSRSAGDLAHIKLRKQAVAQDPPFNLEGVGHPSAISWASPQAEAVSSGHRRLEWKKGRIGHPPSTVPSHACTPRKHGAPLGNNLPRPSPIAAVSSVPCGVSLETQWKSGPPAERCSNRIEHGWYCCFDRGTLSWTCRDDSG